MNDRSVSTTEKALVPARARKAVSSTFGVLVGLAGIDHGIFEVLQGNTRPAGLLIAAIGPNQRFWIHGEETALTVVPSFLWSGVLSIALGLMVIWWSLTRVNKPRGGLILFLLTVALFLVGGGFAPIFMALLASFMAGQVRRPLTWWRRVVPDSLLATVGRLWLPILISFVVLFIVSVEVAIFGWPLVGLYGPDRTLTMLNTLATVMVLFMLLSCLTGLFHDASQVSMQSR